MPSIYKHDYEGCGGMLAVDGRSDLERWFDNYKLDHKADFASEHEWLTIEEKKFAACRRRATRYVGTIGDVEMRGPRRTVVFETNAPAPPTFHRPAKFRPEPRPQRAHDSDTLTIDTIFEAINQLNLSPARRDAMMMNSRGPWDLMERVRAERFAQELDRQTLMINMSAVNWLTPFPAGDGIYSGIDLGSGDMTVMQVLKPIPPPKRYRRNA